MVMGRVGWALGPLFPTRGFGCITESHPPQPGIYIGVFDLSVNLPVGLIFVLLYYL